MGETQKIICKVCSKEFEWSEGEQEFYADRKLDAPKRCKNCRVRKQVKEVQS